MESLYSLGGLAIVVYLLRFITMFTSSYLQHTYHKPTKIR